MRVTGREEVVVEIPGGKPISLPLMFHRPNKNELKKAEQAKAGKDSAREGGGGYCLPHRQTPWGVTGWR